MRKIFTNCLLLVGLTKICFAQQPVSWHPFFATDTDSITVYYDASKGNAALTGITPIYAHTGVITNLSTSLTDWRYVKTNWGVNTPATTLTPLGNNLFKITFHVRNYYAVPASETILKVAYVFRNSTGSIVGRNANGSDIYVPIYQPGLNVAIKEPATGGGNTLIVPNGANIPFTGLASQNANLTLQLNGNLLSQLNNTDSMSFSIVANNTGNNVVHFTGTDGVTTKSDSFSFAVNPPLNIQAMPANIKNGINYINDSTVILNLYAPNKNFVYVIGSFNNWQLNPNYYMNRDPDGKNYWLQINGLTPGQEYTYQYNVDAQIKIGDPYCDKVVDPWNDFSIDNLTYPNKTPYPTGLTSGIVSVLQTAQTPYVWSNTGFVRPPKEKLVVYELLVRDFIAKHNYQTLIDTISYLKNLGINAIELMPINEFEGNLSWGYNPNYFFAVDKYYGTKNKFKEFVDVCHANGIAVIIDVVLNHCFGTSPFAMLYWDATNSRPAANNPWLNPIPKHDFNVGNDFNHDSPDTRAFVDRFNAYWLNEYKVDGFRFDLAKGFTQTNSLGNVGFWGQYDASRVYNIQRMCQHIDSVSAGAYKILELFADNSEETVYANQGIMVWGNHNYNYTEAVMGYVGNSNFSWISYAQRGWNQPSVVGYMESHDEERMLHKTTLYGNTSGGASYNIKDTIISLARVELASAFFIPVPGPKMIWQFGELGYPYSINYCQNGTINTNCRVDPKPIKWNYYSEQARKRLYDVTSALNRLKTNEPVFSTATFNIQFNGQFKRYHLNHVSNNVTILGNFGVFPGNIDPNFQSTGWWYEYFTGDSILISNVNAPINLFQGEYRLYSKNKFTTPLTTSISENNLHTTVYPNPANEVVNVMFYTISTSPVFISITDITGRTVLTDKNISVVTGQQHFSWNLTNDAGNLVTDGVYFIQIMQDHKVQTSKIIVQK